MSAMSWYLIIGAKTRMILAEMVAEISKSPLTIAAVHPRHMFLQRCFFFFLLSLSIMDM